MKVLMIGQHVNFFRSLDSVMRELCRRGHEVVFLHGTRLDDERVRAKITKDASKKRLLGRGLQAVQSEIAGVTSGYRPEPDEPWPLRLRVGRQVINRGIYFRKGHPSPDRVVEGIERSLPAGLQQKVRTPAWRMALGTRSALSVWRWIEAASPPSETLLRLLREIDPDVVLVSPTIWPKDPVEADYLHAARTLGIPTIGFINSWDNLTSKGTVHVVPDLFIVWNEPMAIEAAEIHDVPKETIRITGAPHLDAFFLLRPRMSRQEVCAQMGCPDGPYMVFLCSSRTIWENEIGMVKAMADALAREYLAGPKRAAASHAPTLVVRPHPTNPGVFKAFSYPGVVVHPKDGDQADSSASWQEYYDQLSHATCVFGLNTTAFLEAVMANRPCLTIVSEAYWRAQGRTGHFRHLLKGDFLEVCSDMDDLAAHVRRILEGADEKAEGRRGFTRWFLRPCGLDTPAGEVVADVIESAAQPRGGVAPISDGARRRSVPGLTLASEGIGR
ncbi:MAG TPA: hypothetical protein VI485_07000 [Vicinamibacterales bacterium]|nr:hypothetical protein [Vicinamibacterales bacterium]